MNHIRNQSAGKVCTVFAVVQIILTLATQVSIGSPAEAQASNKSAAQARQPAAGVDWGAMREKFTKPSSTHRIIKIIHGWPEKSEDQDRLIGILKRQGFGGVVCNVSFKDYLESQVLWDSFKRAVNRARQEDMVLWLYDEKGYPSANAGGLVLRDHPEWEAEGLLAVEQDCEAGPLSFKLPPGKPVLATAYPVKEGRLLDAGNISLLDNIENGSLRWTAPPGRWHVLAVTQDRLYEGTHADLNLHQKMPYPNLLMAAPIARFIAMTHERYAQQLGSDLGKWFEATFTDEPSLMSLFIKKMPYRPLPWSSELPEIFARKRGYALAPILPSLFADVGSDAKRHRYDFWLTVGELVSENFFGQIQNWCRPHGIPSGGHLLSEESIVTHVPLYGDFFRCIRHLDAPSIDCLTSEPAQVPWYIARLLGSAAELENNTLVMSETSDHSQRYRAPNDKRPVQNVSESQIRGTCNRQFVAGVNAITSYYSYAGLDDAAISRLNEWVGRCCMLLRGGHQAADIAVLYPAETLWTHFTPANQWANGSPGASRVETIYRAVSESLFKSCRDFTYIDSQAIEKAVIQNSNLEHGSLAWRILVLPGVDTLPEKCWEKLATWVEKGGIIIMAGNTPQNTDKAFPSSRLIERFRSLVPENTQVPGTRGHTSGGGIIFLPQGSEPLLPMILDNTLEPDFHAASSRHPLRVTHRRTSGKELYFVINDSPNPWEGKVQVRSSGRGELWRPTTAQIQNLESSSDIPLRLDAYEAVFLLYSQAKKPEVQRLKSGSIPPWEAFGLPKTTPQVAAGEYVPAFPLRQTDPDKGWQAEARLKKEGVDTWLFLRFHYAENIDLSGAQGLLFETRVPEDQKATTSLLVIVHEKDGGDFLADSRRLMRGPKDSQIVVPFELFELAGWSRDPDGQLDLSRIDEIRIGWGGYIGREDERITFTTSVPHAIKKPIRSSTDAK